MKKRIYISGKITGLDLSVAKENFNMAAEYLKHRFVCEPVNPMKEVPFEVGKKWEDYMLDDIKLIFSCDAIFMLDNWQDSKGARVELAIAKELGKSILFQGNIIHPVR